MKQPETLTAKAIRHEDLVRKAPKAPVGYQRRTLRAAQKALHDRMAEENRLHRLAVRND